jgi:Flp pilus assembly protein TadG
MTRFTRRRSAPGDRGQALTEFALVAPIFFLLVFAVIELGILFGGQNGLVSSARELARYAAPYRVKTAVDATAVCSDTRLSTTLTRWMAGSIPGYTAGNVGVRQVTYSWIANPDNVTYHVQLEIHVSYRFPLHVPLVGGLLDGADGVSDNRFLLDAREQMRIENEDLTATFSPVTCNI